MAASPKPWSLLPLAFIEQLRTLIPPEKLDSVFSSLSVERLPSVRINTLKNTVDDALRKLQQEGISFERVLWCHEALVLIPEQKQDVMKSSLVHEGLVYPQSLSSMLASLILGSTSNDEVLDLCAAPGSKTSHLAAMMQNKGIIIANDSSRSRVFKLQANLKSLGVLNTETTCLPGEWMWKKYPAVFDRVLVDAPCSMEGRFVATDPDTFKDWKPAKGKLLSQKQKYLLRSAVACTKSGGTIVYSTCTLNPRENEEVIDWVLEKEKGTVSLESIDTYGIEVEKGLTSWNKKIFSDEVSKAIRILPSVTMEGFFLAKFRKH